MSKDIILKAENISKQYRLGQVGTGTLSHDINRWWHQIRGKENPYLKIGEINDRSTKGSSDYVWALQDINFEVERGEVLGIIGKNGAGKSTLLKILSKVTAPTTGSIKSRGRIASLLEVGTGFNGEMTGRENIFLNGAILGMTKKEITSKLAEIIEFSGCERYIDTPVKRYSSGMTVRLAFAVAAFLEPEILVIDEVLAVGDAEFQKKAIGKMQDISKGEGRTVLFVSHNMAAVKSLCTRGIVMEHGKVVFDGGIDQSIQRYLSTKNNNIGLIDRKDRLGTGNVKIIDVKIQDYEKIMTGSNMIIELFYKTVVENSRINEFGLSIWDYKENRIISLSSTFKDQLNDISESGVILCEIPNMPLVKGTYKLNCFVSSIFGLEDYIENVQEFDVEDSDIFGTGKTINPEWGMIIVEHNWSKKDVTKN
ncbi:ABC transporter ATP-binding protein [Flavobacterium sp. Fl-77]|uniref:ABC transporter ATP-binding protein n=1 Tax=Flavobacterium flavipigmentatum TaxID=2893884 RepID=A0AAJ2SCI4_9FLAO|nr:MULTISPECIES: ABC transporter ATP-binding protein [unclassified Flavobacterium]MDX6182226.1 ABC transporter ATP-binding protein [Flavobacterium sp. Fl-33]MDX6185861.1 ABC transporter ATP-binding protein [Flavobacterium sp. Fl-77]UFH39040.1 ABC transporter ATP-binding protein [Flavobacterium sp. F-70]